MRILLASLTVFLLAFAASTLLEIDFIARSWVRYSLTVLLIVFILAAGFFIVKAMVTGLNNKSNQ